MTDPTTEPDNEKPGAGGVSAGWVVALVIILTLGLGTAFFLIASSEPVQLVERDAATGQAPAGADASPAEGPR